MMWSVLMLLAAALTVESHTEHLSYGNKLNIGLNFHVDELEFTPDADPSRTIVYWEKGKLRGNRGKVSGTYLKRHWYIENVTFDDQGKYVQRDSGKQHISTVNLVVQPKHEHVKCAAGESFYISLEGIDLANATLMFSNGSGKFKLVDGGSRVSQRLPDFRDRVHTYSKKIEIKTVNSSNVGNYTLVDSNNRVVSVIKMDLKDQGFLKAIRFLAPILLVGIPSAICYFRKKICRPRKYTTATALQTTPGTIHPPPRSLVEPPPLYEGSTVHPPPSTTGLEESNGPPIPTDFNPVYPPLDPAYPPVQPPQWNCSYPGQYPPPPPPAAPMAGPSSYPMVPVPSSCTNSLSYSGKSYQFQISGDSSTNFL